VKRYNVHLTERQIKVLTARAEKLGIKTAELIRRILDEHLNQSGC